MPQTRYNIVLAILFIASLCAPLGAQSTELTSNFERNLSSLKLLGQRTEGSPGETAALAYIKKICDLDSLTFRENSLSDLVADQSFSKALTIQFAGTKSDLLTIIVSLDCHFDGPPGEGDAGIALALAAAQDLGKLLKSGETLPLSLDIVFLGGEQRGPLSEGSTSGTGSRWWLENIDESRANAVVYLSIDDKPGALGLRNASLGILSPYWLYDTTRSALAKSGFEYRLFSNRMQGYRLGLLARPGPLVPYLAAGIPAIELRSEGGGTPLADPSAHFTRCLREIVVANSSGFLDVWDRDYSSFQLGSFSVVIREGPYVVFLLAFTGIIAFAVLLLSIVRRGTIPALIRKLPRRLGFVGILLLAASLCFLSTWLSLRIETTILGSGEAWKALPSLFSIIRIVFTLVLFLGLVSWFVSHRWLSPDPWFYEAAAVILLGFDVLLFAFISLPISIYFCWGLAVAFISILIRKPLVSVLAIFLLYLPFALLILEMIATPEASSLTILLSPNPIVGIFLLFTVLPFASLTVSPLLFLAPRGERRRRSAARFFVASAFLLELVLILAASVNSRNAPLDISEAVDQDSATFALELKSFARLGDLELLRNKQPLFVSSRIDHANLGGIDSSHYIVAKVVDKPFLDRVNHGVSLDFFKLPFALELSLSCPQPLAIYDCSFPYKVALDGRSAKIFVGPGSPNPLFIEVTTSPEFSAILHVRASYSASSENYGTTNSRPVRSGELKVDASFKIGKNTQ